MNPHHKPGWDYKTNSRNLEDQPEYLHVHRGGDESQRVRGAARARQGTEAVLRGALAGMDSSVVVCGA